MNKLIYVLGTFVVVATACGSTTIIIGTGGTGADTGTGNSSGTATTTTTSASGCPATEPTGGSCASLPSGLHCTYGDSVRPECRDEWDCVNGQWAAPGDVCITPPASTCGTSEPPVGTTCANNGDVCTYGNTICICDPCAGGLCMMSPPIKWQCVSPPATSGCPSAVPNDGTACTQNGLECSYGFPCTPSGAVVDCTNGAWTWNKMVACAG